jgi:uncharacterized protein YpmB
VGSFKKETIIKIFIFIAIVLVSINFFELYQNKFSKERKEVRNYIYKQKNLSALVGGISKLTWEKSTYTSNRKVFKYLVIGRDKNVYLKIYFTKDKNTSKIKIKKITLQNPLTGETISNNFI